MGRVPRGVYSRAPGWAVPFVLAALQAPVAAERAAGSDPGPCAVVEAVAPAVFKGLGLEG